YLADRIANFATNDISPNTDYTVNYGDGRTSATYRIRCAPGTAANTPLANCPATSLQEGGFTKLVQDFEVIAAADHPDNTAFSTVFPIQANATVHQIASLKQTSIFSYAIFYDSDLEVLPGPDMTMTGFIHANGDMYLGARSNLTLDTDSVHATGAFHNERKDNPNDIMQGTVKIKKSGTSTYPAMTFDSDSPTWAQDATSTWNGTVQSADHGVGYVQPVTIPSIQPNGFYYNNAGLRVIDGQVYKRESNGSYTQVPSGDLPSGTVTQKQFRNYRESSSHDVVVTEIDVNKLRSTNYFPSNGLIYASRTNAVPASSSGSATSHGIRLVNGTDVKPNGATGGLTVVSNNPLYVKGDFNTQKHDAQGNTITGKRSVALISDALNILSNSWSDSNSSQSLGNRVASNTTVNAGFVSGVVPTNGSQYSGGFENYPRFLEKWTSKNANVSGAFINLWNSQIATGQWVYGGNYYEAPIRNWEYDSNLKSNPPPFTPVGVEISTKTWWQEGKESLSL
ncbi:MAG: hypothetical protein HY582_04930, partial [Candidatus Omnitrophica bacterium]|nr:hypothetical protein [Candidatus Omnitrophota bacterium]